MPQRLALALQADGWILRSRMPGGEMRPDVIWRSNKMPESVRDRPSKDYEDVLIFAKGRSYYWDQEAGREPGNLKAGGGRCWYDGGGTVTHGQGSHTLGLPHASRNMRAAWTPADVVERAPMRELWDIPSEPTSVQHFASFPEMLAARLIAVGTSERGCCPECGRGWVRERESDSGGSIEFGTWRDHGHDPKDGSSPRHYRNSGGAGFAKTYRRGATIGWSPPCACAHLPAGHDPEPCRVLDPFTGIGRTWQAARRLGRRFYGADLSLSYCLTARQRNASVPLVDRRVETGQASLFEVA